MGLSAHDIMCLSLTGYQPGIEFVFDGFNIVRYLYFVKVSVVIFLLLPIARAVSMFLSNRQYIDDLLPIARVVPIMMANAQCIGHLLPIARVVPIWQMRRILRI